MLVVGVKSARERLVESPLPLALLRIVMPLVILVSPELHASRALAAAPARLGFIPEGLGLVAHLPIGPGVARVLHIVAVSSAATAILGYRSRMSMAALTLSAGLLFSLTQRQGAVLHDMHLFWMTALLAVSPCGDAWSLDAWSQPRPGPSLRYGVPLFFARLLLGLVYFFPGFHKLRVSGLAWVSAENVTNQMHAKWLEHDALPALRIDAYPTLCIVGAVLAVTFELTFIVLALWSRRTRWVALGAGLAFHFATQAFFLIPFVSLWACYVMLIAPPRERQLAPDQAKLPRAPLIAGAVLVLAVLVQGVRARTEAWPFACYPTFANVQAATIPDVLVDVALTDGTTARLTGREHGARSQDEWGRVFRLSGAYGDTPPEGALRDHARAVLLGSGIASADVASTKIYRVQVATAPQAWREPPLGGTLLLQLTGYP